MKTGVSLVELLVVIALSSFIFIIVTSLMASLLTLSSKSRQQQTIATAKNDLLTTISDSVRWGQTFRIDNSVSLLQIDGKSFQLVNGQVQKDGVPITSSDVQVKDWLVTNYSPLSAYPSLEIRLNLKSQSSPLIKDQLRFVISTRKTSIQIHQ